MKLLKSTVSILMVAAITLSMAGCGKNENNTDKKELTLFMYDNNQPFDDEYPIYKEAEKMTGIHIKGTLSKSTTDASAAFNLMIATGNLADIIYTNGRANFAKYGSEGAFIPLNDLIDKYAPNIKKVLEDNPDIKDFITANDGNIYFIPFMPDGEATEGWFIRKDWLDKLGLSEPKTIDELYNVLTAFKTKDPNGNGEADEIPYFSRNPVSGINKLYTFWGMNGGLYVENGEVKYSPIEENFREATKVIAKWYKEGLIDPEIYTRGSNSRDFMLGNNMGGITHDWFASTGAYNDKLQSSIPGFNFIAIAPPAGSDGKIREFAKRMNVQDCGYAISSANKNPEKTIKWIDFWFTDEGNRLMNYGIEGDDYIVVDSKPVFTDKVLNDDKGVAQYLQARGAQGNVPFEQDFEYERQWMNKTALAGTEMYVNNNYFTEQYVAPLMNEEDQNKYDGIMTNVQTLVNEKTQKWILGSEDIDSNYDEFIDNLKKMGIDDALELLRKYYK